MHEEDRIDQPRIGTERFNYELQRHEILLPSGWNPVSAGYCPPDNANREAQNAIVYDKARRTLVPRSSVVPPPEEWERPSPWLHVKASPPGRSQEIQTHEANLTRENLMLRAERDAWKKLHDDKQAIERGVLEELRLRRECMAEQDRELTELRKRLWLPVEPGDHPYNGPLSRPDENGRRVPVADPVHERFHGSIGDVLRGRVMTSARRQMQEALKNAPREQVALPTTGSEDDPRRLGCEWLARL